MRKPYLKPEEEVFAVNTSQIIAESPAQSKSLQGSQLYFEMGNGVQEVKGMSNLYSSTSEDVWDNEW